jgi:hypothetical protein
VNHDGAAANSAHATLEVSDGVRTPKALQRKETDGCQ